MGRGGGLLDDRAIGREVPARERDGTRQPAPARRAGRTLLRMLAGEVEPKMVWGDRPIMSSSLVHTPSREPMKTLMGMANEAEDTGKVLNASVFGGFPQADIPHLALSSVIVCDRRTAEGEILLNKILDTAWEKREGFLFHPEPLSVQVARAKSLDGGPVVMADHGDNTASGGTQDVMSVIEEAMKQGLEDACAGPICDPGCVEQMIKAGVGAEVTLDLGGKIDASIDLAQGASGVTLTIQDSQGRTVQELIAGAQTPGTVQLSWDGLDAMDNPVPSGSYRLIANAVVGGKNTQVPVQTMVTIVGAKTGADGSVSLQLDGGKTVLLKDVQKVGL